VEDNVVNLTSEPIDLNQLLLATEDHSTGGVVLFLGRVRNHAGGRSVLSMEYEAYGEMALVKMQEIVDQARQRWPVRKIAVLHRTGHLQRGEVSVAIAVACAHRKQRQSVKKMNMYLVQNCSGL
jgi:molybdopterin synthase catalytic subunit